MLRYRLGTPFRLLALRAFAGVSLMATPPPDCVRAPVARLPAFLGQKKTPATATNSPGAVTGANEEVHTDAQKCSRNLVRIKDR